MNILENVAILDITELGYGHHYDKTRLYIDMNDLPWDTETEEFWDDDDDAWTDWAEEIRNGCIRIVKVEFKVIDRWANKVRTIHVKEF